MKNLLLMTLLLLNSCVSQQVQKLNPETYYRPDICVTYDTIQLGEKKKVKFFKRLFSRKYRKKLKRDKVTTFCGVGVLPYMDKYKLEIKAYGKMDFFSITSCHEENSTESPDAGIFTTKGKATINYVPTIERGKACPLYLSVYNKRGKHAFGMVAFEDPRYELDAVLHCNGYVATYNGVSICSSRQGLIQRITFDEPVKLVDPVIGGVEKKEPCPSLGEDYKKSYEFKLPARECIYQFIGKNSGQIHQMFTAGYENIIVRE